MWLLISISRSPWNSDLSLSDSQHTVCPPSHHLKDSEDWLPLMILIVVSDVTPPVTLHDAFEIFLYTHLRSVPPTYTHIHSGSRCGWYCHLSHFINDAWFIYNFKQIIKGWFSRTWSFLLSMWKSWHHKLLLYCLLGIPTILQQILFCIIFQEKSRVRQHKISQMKDTHSMQSSLIRWI